jgi:hypothetical protein
VLAGGRHGTIGPAGPPARHGPIWPRSCRAWAEAAARGQARHGLIDDSCRAWPGTGPAGTARTVGHLYPEVPLQMDEELARTGAAILAVVARGGGGAVNEMDGGGQW